MNDDTYFFDGAKDQQNEQQDRDWMDDAPLSEAEIEAILDAEWPWDDRDEEIAAYEREYQRHAA